ncbi:hypothetical protein [Rothia aeria]|uniref:hypothetical protein n=1 Tax=Rothia aeria TaxID=172042 RepID=UPI00244A2B02|nr:hypothetical protein [Rothia aeria]
MEASSKKLQDKLSMLHATKMTEKLIGINLLSVSADSPYNTEWISDFDINDIYKENPRFRFPYGVRIDSLAESLDFICAPQNEFLIIYYDYSPIYISFQITKLAEFLKSYAKEQKSLDITLFYLNRREVIDIFIEENDIEVRVMPIFDY